MSTKWVSLDLGKPIWSSFFTIGPLYVVGTIGENGEPDMAPKHLAMPMSWDNHFGFVCSPHHTTFQNIERNQVFTVSAPRPDQVVLTSLAASPRCEDGTKPVVNALPTVRGNSVAAPCLKDAYFHLECRWQQTVTDLGSNLLIIGKVIEARIHQDVICLHDGDPQQQLMEHPLLAFIPPARFAAVDRTQAFPFPKGFAP